MALRRHELDHIVGYLSHASDAIEGSLLERIELGVWIFGPPFFQLMPRTEPNSSEPLFLSGRFGANVSAEILSLFRDRLLPYLLIRVRSWECYINCDGEILSEHCEENLDAVREACERLRERCGRKDAHPAIRN